MPILRWVRQTSDTRISSEPPTRTVARSPRRSTSWSGPKPRTAASIRRSTRSPGLREDVTAQPRRPKLDEQVVVITGASQGIGRETALLLARRGASVVAAARNEEALGTLAAEVSGAGGRIEPVVADVSDYASVERIADRAIEVFGRIDTWVNNAAVSMYATVEELQPDELERIVRVNLLGQMFGSKVAAARMRGAGRGTIINVGSALSERAIPLQSAYVATKHGIAGFSEALRLELEGSRSGIDVVLILPSSINTPLFNFARSRLGVMPTPVPPVYEPSVVAEA